MTDENNNQRYSFGITSKCKDGKHIFMADIDEDIGLSNIIDICENIIINSDITSLYIVKSTNGYNLFSLDKVPLKLIYNVNKNIPSIDQIYNNLAYNNRRFYVLRIGFDKKYMLSVGSDNSTYVKSNAHRIFFNNMFNLNIQYDNVSFDDSDVFQIIRFRCQKHGVYLNE